MITARLHLVEGLYQGFTITGHADGAREDNEYDLICAAVSAITLTMAALFTYSRITLGRMEEIP